MVDNNLNQEILDKITKVCVCKSISRTSIKEAITNGANTLDKVKTVTGATTGACNGCRCIPKIEELLKNNNSSK